MRADPATDPLIGVVIGGRYQLVKRVGKGGMGVVYEADHLGLGKRVAVKLLLDKYTDDDEVVARFQREARTASSIGDDHIVEVTDAGTTEDGRSFLVMELLVGESLSQVAEATGPMPAERAVLIVRQILHGLGAAHAKGIVHRDMKPENVFLIQKAGRPDFVKIMDFGISKFMALTESKVRLTATGAVIGTPVYMAPEQAMGTGEIDARVDLYAVGVMLYELLAGRPPFEAPTYIALVTQHLNAPPPPLSAVRPDLPRSLVFAVHRALEKDPARRYASAAEMAKALPTDAELAGLDRIPTLSGPTIDWSADPASTAAETPAARNRAARPMPTPGAAQVPTTSRRGRLDPAAMIAPPRPATTMQTAARRWPLLLALFAAAAVVGAGVVVLVTRPDDARKPTPSAGSATAPPQAVTSSLEVVSEPAGAAVTVDGVARGNTPIVVAGLSAGVHEVRLDKDGYQPVVMRKAVRENRDETLSAVMARGAAPAGTRDAGGAPRGKPTRGTAPGSGSASGSGSGSGSGSDSGSGSGSGSASGSGSGSGSGSASGSGSGSGAKGGSGRKPHNPYGDPTTNPDRKDNPFGP